MPNQIPILSVPEEISSQDNVEHFCLKVFNFFPLDLHLWRKKFGPKWENVTGDL